MKNEYFDKLENVLPQIKSDSVQMIFIDAPFTTTKAKWDTPIDLELFWKEAWRILKPNGVVIAKAQPPFNIVLGASQLKHLKYEWIWEKTSATGGLNSKKMPMKASENLMVYYKKQPIYNPQMTTGHVRKVSSAKNRAACIERRNEKDDYIYNKEYAEKVEGYDSTERYPRNVLKFASDKQKLAIHPTQTPLALCEYFVKTYTNLGDTILDPCRGSNTMGVACDNLGREFIGIEMTEQFFRMGTLRREFPNLKTKEIKELFKQRFGEDYKH
jgi:site-specific DNA-methyltransferase (adenine-specific)